LVGKRKAEIDDYVKIVKNFGVHDYPSVVGSIYKVIATTYGSDYDTQINTGAWLHDDEYVVIENHKEVNVAHTKPPIGIEPRWVHSAVRLNELVAAIVRYIKAGLEVPVEWIEEYNDLNLKYGHYKREI
jgi:hypothetical protein